MLFTLRPRNSIYENVDGVMKHKHVGYLILKLTPMVEEISGGGKNSKISDGFQSNKNQQDFKKYVPDYEQSYSFVLTSKNIGGILAMKTTNYQVEGNQQILESTTSRAQKEDFTSLLKIEQKLKSEPTDDKVEYEIRYLEAKDEKLITNSTITLSLGQMIVFQLLCKKFLTENIHGWNILNRKY